MDSFDKHLRIAASSGVFVGVTLVVMIILHAFVFPDAQGGIAILFSPVYGLLLGISFSAIVLGALRAVAAKKSGTPVGALLGLMIFGILVFTAMACFFVGELYQHLAS